MKHARTTLTLAALLLTAATARGQLVNYEMVTVGNPRNSNDTINTGTNPNYGAVAYEYRIGKYEVTIAQYASFLNAVAAADPFSLYSEQMGTDLSNAGITRSGSSGSYTYGVMNNGGSSGSRPITWVSWFDAARFANWMQNGQGSGDTETGAYTLNGATSGTAPAKNPGATFYIPTENEWYKAAYYSPLLNSGAGGYHTLATQSNSRPGNTIGGEANQANYQSDVSGTYVYAVTQSSTFSSSQNYLTDVGAFVNSASYYGTLDQSGNTGEWNDLSDTSSTERGIRGGMWNNNSPFQLSSRLRYSISAAEGVGARGFRLAAPVPEPSTIAMALAGIACGGFSMRRRRKRA